MESGDKGITEVKGEEASSSTWIQGILQKEGCRGNRLFTVNEGRGS